MNILICCNIKKSIAAVNEVCQKLQSLGAYLMMPEFVKSHIDMPYVEYGETDVLIKKSDYIITIGGDGTILKWGKIAAKSHIPLLGINTGRLGFMATLECDELEKLERLGSKDFTTSRRMLLDVRIEKADGEVIESVALNDVVFFKDTYAKLPEFCVSSNNTEVAKMRADGLIFSTPTGSTAYSLSAGGPIIDPEMECIEFTPLCAHTLFARPMIFASEKTISVSYNAYQNSNVNISIDGDSGIVFGEKDNLLMKKSSICLDLIDIDGAGFYDAIHDKLMRPLK